MRNLGYTTLAFFAGFSPWILLTSLVEIDPAVVIVGSFYTGSAVCVIAFAALKLGAHHELEVKDNKPKTF